MAENLDKVEAVWHDLLPEERIVLSDVESGNVQEVRGIIEQCRPIIDLQVLRRSICMLFRF